jgi:hypothetical protein
VSQRVVRYTGPPPFAGILVQRLEEQGVEVEWEPPYEQRGAGGIMEQVVIPLLVTGAYDAIKVGVRLFRERFPRGTVTVEELDKEGLST